MEEKPKITDKISDKRLKNLKAPWKKGEQGGGHRHKGQRDYATLRTLAMIEIAKANKKTPKEIEVMLIQKGISEGLKGDFRYYKDDLDRVHGQATNITDFSGTVQIQGVEISVRK